MDAKTSLQKDLPEIIKNLKQMKMDIYLMRAMKPFDYRTEVIYITTLTSMRHMLAHALSTVARAISNDMLRVALSN